MDDLLVEMRFDFHLFREMRQQVGDMNVLDELLEERSWRGKADKKKIGAANGQANDLRCNVKFILGSKNVIYS